MVSKNFCYFNSCDVTKNIGAGESSNKSISWEVLPRKENTGRTRIPKEDATETISHVKAHWVCSTSRSYAERPLAQWSLSESVKGNKEMKTGFKTDHTAYKTAEVKSVDVEFNRIWAGSSGVAFQLIVEKYHPLFSPFSTNLYIFPRF